jgi:TM2 domain-containing membrane protein YozV
MTSQTTPQRETQQAPAVPQVDLKDPWLAAFLAWLVPGAGHFYQGRTGKGFLFLVCILGTFIFGLYLGQGRVVYASMRPEDRRLPYLCQFGAGVVATPALVQAQRVRSGKEPLWSGFMAPPDLRRPIHATDDQGKPIIFPHELSKWHYELHSYFELGTVYTMIAGLLNVLAIFDAFAGPAPWVRRKEETGEEGADKRSRPPDPGS